MKPFVRSQVLVLSFATVGLLFVSPLPAEARPVRSRSVVAHGLPSAVRSDMARRGCVAAACGRRQAGSIEGVYGGGESGDAVPRSDVGYGRGGIAAAFGVYGSAVRDADPACRSLRFWESSPRCRAVD